MVLISTAQLIAVSDDKERCQTVAERILDFTKKNGSKAQLVRAYKTQLPSSPIYSFLEGRIPPPAHTFLRIIETVEDVEDETIATEFDARRTRIGAKKDKVKAEVKREVYGKSELSELYQGMIDWTSDDEQRREYEDKKLARVYDHLLVMGQDEKEELRKQVMEMAHGMVIIKHPNPLAWDIELEWKDLEKIGDLDVNIVREYIQFFPDSGLTKVLNAYMSSDINPFPVAAPVLDLDLSDDEADEFGGAGVSLIAPEDRLVLMSDGLSEASSSPLAHRLVGEYYNHLEEYESTVETTRKGVQRCKAEARKCGLSLQANLDAMNTILANALIIYQTPRNHPESKTLFEDILLRKPNFTPALLGSGLILEEEHKFSAALEYLEKALKRDSGNVRIGVEAAWCRALNGDIEGGLTSLANYLEEMDPTDQTSRELRAETLYRIGKCQWDLKTDRASRKDRKGPYAKFLAAVKANINFAPAYTSLGIYYEEYSKDRKRARQCFQKAFDLSASELIAAERLAKSFADQKDWDIVEVIAQRVVDSGKARPPPGSHRKAISWPYSALGVVQMNRLEYQKAIVSFLAALRISPDDYHSYVGLGESYHNSGRYNSALRTFSYVQSPDDSIIMKSSSEDWFTKYMLANVSRELGSFSEAEASYRTVLETRPNEFGVEIALTQTLIQHAWRAIETGFYGEAAGCASQSLDVALSIVQYKADAFNLWRAVSDACAVFTWVQQFAFQFPSQKVHQILSHEFDLKSYDVFSEVDSIGQSKLQEVKQHDPSNEESKDNIIYVANVCAILARKRAIDTAAQDVHAQAVAWYNLGWTEYRAHVCLEQQAEITGKPSKSKKFLKASMRAFKRAIELEAGNADFWNSLGVATTKLNPKVAQHAFVRSLHLNERDPKVWSNLGTLYILQSDYELAHAAFSRAQSADPDYSHAWVGEGIVALLYGKVKEALLHFTHAFEISDMSTTIVKKEFALYAFDSISSKIASSDLLSIQPLLALRQLRTLGSSNAPYDHLAALYHERVGDYTAAVTNLVEVCNTLEAAYEETEDPETLVKFIQAKTDLARNYLATSSYEDAASEAETALDLIPEDEDSKFSASLRRKILVSGRLTIGLSKYYLQDMDGALVAFRAALEETKASPDILCSLAEVLWAKGGTAERGVAKEQLFDSINHAGDSAHVGSVVLLGAMVAIEGDTELMDAVIDELEPLRTRDKITPTDLARVEKVLETMRDLSLSNAASALGQVQKSIMLAPYGSHGWTRLAGHTAQDNDEDASNQAAAMALRAAQRHIPPRGPVTPVQLADAFAGTSKAGDAQRAIMVAPYSAAGWVSLAEAITAK
jgi:superkiller protein 3